MSGLSQHRISERIAKAYDTTTPSLDKLMSQLKASMAKLRIPGEPHIFGGYVRDMIGGRNARDYDIVINVGTRDTESRIVDIITFLTKSGLVLADAKDGKGAIRGASFMFQSHEYGHDMIVVKGVFKPYARSNDAIMVDLVFVRSFESLGYDFTINQHMLTHDGSVSARGMYNSNGRMEIQRTCMSDILNDTLRPSVFVERIDNAVERKWVAYKLLQRLMKFLDQLDVTFITTGSDGVQIEDTKRVSSTMVDLIPSCTILGKTSPYTISSRGLWNVRIDKEKITYFPKDKPCPLCKDPANIISLRFGATCDHSVCPACIIKLVGTSNADRDCSCPICHIGNVNDSPEPECIIITSPVKGQPTYAEYPFTYKKYVVRAPLPPIASAAASTVTPSAPSTDAAAATSTVTPSAAPDTAATAAPSTEAPTAPSTVTPTAPSIEATTASTTDKDPNAEYRDVLSESVRSASYKATTAARAVHAIARTVYNSGNYSGMIHLDRKAKLDAGLSTACAKSLAAAQDAATAVCRLLVTDDLEVAISADRDAHAANGAAQAALHNAGALACFTIACVDTTPDNSDADWIVAANHAVAAAYHSIA